METTKRLLILCLLLGMTAAFVLVDQVLSSHATEMNLEKLPLTFADWQGHSFPVDSRIKEILETEYILSRDYVNKDGKRVFLSLVYYPDNKIGFHNPESCNSGVGMKVLDNRLIPLQVAIPGGGYQEMVVNRLILGVSEPERVIYYFFATATAMTGNYPKFRLEMLKQQLAFNRPTGAQVQIHITVRDSVEATLPLAEAFVSSFVPVLQGFF